MLRHKVKHGEMNTEQITIKNSIAILFRDLRQKHFVVINYIMIK